MHYIILFVILLVTVGVLVTNSFSSANENLRRDIHCGVFNRTIKKPGFIRFRKRRLIKETIQKIATSDAHSHLDNKNGYSNSYDVEEYAELYKMTYRKAREEVIKKTAEKNVSAQNFTDAFDDPVERKMYRAAYVKALSDAKRKESASPWDDEHEESDNSSVDFDDLSTEEFVTMFVDKEVQNNSQKNL